MAIMIKLFLTIFAMKEDFLLKTALCCAVFGILVLYFVSDNISADAMAISKIDMTEADTVVEISGEVKKISGTEKVAFISVHDCAAVDVLLFEDSEKVNLSVGDDVKVVGKVEDYEGKKEIIADSIELHPKTIKSFQ